MSSSFGAEYLQQCLFNKCLGNSSCSNNDLFIFYNNNKTTKYCETTTHKNRFLDVNQHYMRSLLIEYFCKISHGLFYYPHCCCLIFFYLPVWYNTWFTFKEASFSSSFVIFIFIRDLKQSQINWPIKYI